MGNATKVALVALLILLVVVVARFVREDSNAGTEVAAGPGSVLPPAGASTSQGKVPARGTTGAPASLATRGKQAATVPQISRNPAAILPGSPTILPGSPAILSGNSTGLPAQPPGGQGTSRGVPSPAYAGHAAPPGGSPAAGERAETPSGPATPRPATGLAGGPTPGTTQPGNPTTPTPPLPAPNPIGSLQDSRDLAGGAARPTGSKARLQTQLPGLPRDGASPGPAPGSREATSPFRPLAESGRPLEPREARGNPSAENLSSGVAREPARPERSSAAGGYPKTHDVVKGDTFWGLAERYYGNGALVHVIQKANPGVKLRPGMRVTIPESPPATALREPRAEPPEPRASSPSRPAAPAAGRDYVVQKGDTLGHIARKVYGDAGKLHLIEEANPELKYQMLRAGARIKVPAE